MMNKKKFKKIFQEIRQNVIDEYKYLKFDFIEKINKYFQILEVFTLFVGLLGVFFESLFAYVLIRTLRLKGTIKLDLSSNYFE